MPVAQKWRRSKASSVVSEYVVKTDFSLMTVINEASIGVTNTMLTHDMCPGGRTRRMFPSKLANN